MGNCLVTKLKGVVNNDNLLKVGEMRISFKGGRERTTSFYRIKIFGTEEIKLTILGNNQNAFFGTAIDSASGVRELTIPATTDSNTVPTYYLSDEDCEISVHNDSGTAKYCLTQVTVGTAGIVNIEDLKYTDGLSSLQIGGDITNPTERYSNSYGDISVLAGKSIVSLNVRNTKVTGNLSNICQPALRNLNLNLTAVEGDIAALAACTAASDFQVSDCPNLYGDIATLSSLENLIKLQTINCSEIYGDATQIISRDTFTSANDLFNNTSVICDISQLPASVAYISVLGTANRTFKWKTQRHATSGAKMIAMQCSAGVAGLNVGSDLKAMFIDQAQCTFAPPSQSSWYKTIDVAGTYDSSDAELATAIATVKAAGMTVKINGATV